jgi:mono/diheme cytochrome c family protein
MSRAGADGRRGLVVAAAVALIAGCGGETVPDPNAEPTAQQIARGEAVYQEICSECHSVQPPPRLAPPLSHVGRMVKSRVDDREAFTRHIVTYVQAPSEERSLLPAEAIRRFGLMPAQTLPEHQIADAAAYVWILADSAQGGMDHGGGMGEGMGGMDHEGGMGEGMGGMDRGQGMGGEMGMGRRMRGGAAAGDTTTAGDTIR